MNRGLLDLQTISQTASRRIFWGRGHITLIHVGPQFEQQINLMGVFRLLPFVGSKFRTGSLFDVTVQGHISLTITFLFCLLTTERAMLFLH